MAKITIEELYRGEKYDIMSAVTAKALQLGIDERTEEGRTWIEMELVRQTVIAIEQMKKNGDCIAEGELGDMVTVFICGSRFCSKLRLNGKRIAKRGKGRKNVAVFSRLFRNSVKFCRMASVKLVCPLGNGIVGKAEKRIGVEHIFGGVFAYSRRIGSKTVWDIRLHIIIEGYTDNLLKLRLYFILVVIALGVFGYIE